MTNGRLWRLDLLIPALIVAFLLGDVACRFVRLDFLAFRGDEAVSQYPSGSVLGPYEPNRRYESDSSSGDLPSMSNQRQYRVFRKQTFTTDANGFRNVSSAESVPPSVLMVGDSFTIGTGNDDDETLPVQVGKLSGCRTYNAGALSAYAEMILKVARKQGMKDGLVVVEIVARNVGKPAAPLGKERFPSLPYRAELRAFYLTMKSRLSKSPLQIILQRAYKSLENDQILPNGYKEIVAVRHLKDGRAMLFHRGYESAKPFDGILAHAQGFATLRDELKAAGFDLAVVIVPEKQTVYESMVQEPITSEQESVDLLNAFEQALRAKLVPVVNLTPILTARAKESYQSGELLYWLDDTHWNAKGIAVAAEAIVEKLDLRGRCARTPKSN